MKKQFVKDLKPGVFVKSIFIVAEEEKALTKDKKTYISLILADKTGRIYGKIWDNATELGKLFKKGDIVEISGSITAYKETPQIRVETLRKCSEEEIDRADFLPVTEKDRDVLLKNFLEIAGSVQNPYFKSLLKNIFTNERIIDGIKNAPASVSIHHSYVGGLLEHILNVVKICETVVSMYPVVDRDLLITGALLHDIGKIEEYNYSKIIEHTDSGKLLGHIALEMVFISKEIEKIQSFPDNLKIDLLHLILSHHGEREFGSPKIPCTVEAAALAYADLLDSRVESFIEVANNNKENWSGYIGFLGRKVFKRQE